MGIFWSDAQPAVKKETKRVAFLTCMGTVVMWGAFAVLHRTVSDKIPFDYRVILGGVGGTFTAVFNFFLMGLAVQEIAVIPMKRGQGRVCRRAIQKESCCRSCGSFLRLLFLFFRLRQGLSLFSFQEHF